MTVRLFVVGATGGTGRCVVEAALARGWEVTAFVRSPEKLAPRAALRAVKGEVTDTTAFAAALPGHDAVICALGQQFGTPPTLMRDAAAALIPAMETAGVRRLLAVSGSGVKFPGDGPPPLFERLAVRVVRVVLPRLLDDTRGYADTFAASALDWTLVRPMRLTDGPGGRPMKVADTMPYSAADAVDRRDVATFLLDQVSSPTWVRRTPMLTASR